MNLTLKDIDTILKNENHYKKVVSIHFLERNNYTNDLGVQNNNNCNTQEKSIVTKIEDNDYSRAKLYLESINKMYEQLSEREKLIYTNRYKYKMSVEQISFKINFSVDTIWKDLNNIKKTLQKIINCKK